MSLKSLYSSSFLPLPFLVSIKGKKNCPIARNFKPKYFGNHHHILSNMTREMIQKDASDKLEWRINVPNGTSVTLVPECGAVRRVWLGLKNAILGFVLKVWKFLEKAWNIGVDEPKKVMHCLKVGLALTIVSVFYYMRPLYDGVGGNAMWAIMTVVVVFEYTVGATLCKSINRAIGTLLAGALGVGVHSVASQSGERFEPVILGISTFLLASAATFSRFIPSVKARFDYGAMIFILTFSLVSVSGYRVDELFELAHQRLSTIAIGTFLCILISMLFYPMWAGEELHNIVTRNLEKLANSLDGCVVEYFKDDGTEIVNEEDSSKKMQGYKCVLNSKGTEDSMANFARWEPAHGCFNFRHPWKQYLKVAASMRNCAYCIETLNGCANSEIQAPEFLKKQLSNVCTKLSSNSSSVLEELTVTMKTMTRSTKIELLVGEMNYAVQELQNGLKHLPPVVAHSPPPATHEAASDNGKTETSAKATLPPLIEVFPLATLVSLLIEIAARVEGVVDTVDELANLAEFKLPSDKKLKQNQHTNKLTADSQDHVTVKVIQKV